MSDTDMQTQGQDIYFQTKLISIFMQDLGKQGQTKLNFSRLRAFCDKTQISLKKITKMSSRSAFIILIVSKGS